MPWQRLYRARSTGAELIYIPSRDDFPEMTDLEFEDHLADFYQDLEEGLDYFDDYLLENWIE